MSYQLTKTYHASAITTQHDTWCNNDHKRMGEKSFIAGERQVGFIFFLPHNGKNSRNTLNTRNHP